MHWSTHERVMTVQYHTILTIRVLSPLLNSNRFVFLIPRVPFTNMCREENSPCERIESPVNVSSSYTQPAVTHSILLSALIHPCLRKTKGQKEARQVVTKQRLLKSTLMNVGFHTLNVTLTWLISASGMEQVNDAQYSSAEQVCRTKENQTR